MGVHPTLPLDIALDTLPRSLGLLNLEVEGGATTWPEGPWVLDPQDLWSKIMPLWGHPPSNRISALRTTVAIPPRRTRYSSKITFYNYANKLRVRPR
jgi:hypothetical protein